MTVSKTRGRKVKMCCDQAGCKAQFGEPFYWTELKGAASSARANGWQVKKTKFGNWRHFCPAHNSGDGDDRGGRRPPTPTPEPPTTRFYWQDF